MFFNYTLYTCLLGFFVLVELIANISIALFQRQNNTFPFGETCSKPVYRGKKYIMYQNFRVLITVVTAKNKVSFKMFISVFPIFPTQTLHFNFIST